MPEDQERGGATVDLEAIRSRIKAWQAYRGERVADNDRELWAGAFALSAVANDAPVLLTEVDSLRAQLAERDGATSGDVEDCDCGALTCPCPARQSIPGFRAQLAERDAQIADLDELRRYNEASFARRRDELEAQVEAMRGVVEIGRAIIAYPHETYRARLGAALAALDQVQQQTAQEGQQPQQSLEQHSGEPETTDSAEGPEKGLK